MTDLLRVVRTPRPQFDVRSRAFTGPMRPLTRAPSFLSGGLPRDRRGRIAQKQMSKGFAGLLGMAGLRDGEEEDAFGDETPRNGSTGLVIDVEREREREFLEALRFVHAHHQG